MSAEKAKNPFHFHTQLNLIELTEWKARDLDELLHFLKKAPSSMIYYHTHHFLKQHQFLSPEPPNDFAYWVTHVLQEDVLGEQLASIDSIQFSSIKSLGEKILGVIEKFLAKQKSDRMAPPGEEFHFMKSEGFVLPTHYVVSDLAEFVEAIKKISIHSIYHHVFEARLRLARGSNDFSFWLANELGEKSLAAAISKLDPYTQTLEGLRRRIIYLGEKRLQEKEKVTLHAS